MRRLLLWFRAHRIATWTLRVILILWGIQLWMNWAAERAWRQYCDEARKRGLKLTLAEFTPPEIPDAENFAMLPMFKGAWAGESLEVYFRPARPLGDRPTSPDLPSLNPTYVVGSSWTAPPYGNPLGSFRYPWSSLSQDDPIRGQSLDWEQWQREFKTAGLITTVSSDPVAGVLGGFDRFAPQIKEWQEWRQRPRCQFPFDARPGSDTSVPPTYLLESATQVFGWRLRVHLAQGDSAAAVEDFRDAFQSYRALRDEPTAVVGLTRNWVLEFVSRRIATGLAAHQWTEPELRAIEAELSKVRILEDYRLALSSERARTMDWFNLWNASGVEKRAQMFVEFLGGKLFAWTPGWPQRSIGFCFSGRGLRKNQLRMDRYFAELLARISDDGSRLDLDRATPSAGKTDGVSTLPDWNYLLFNMTAYRIGFLEKPYVRAMTDFHQLRLAIALERYHLLHGRFPETLDALVPDFLSALPGDPWSGMSMKYRREKTNSYMLYSVGENRRDDGGLFDPKKPDYRQLDAIWRYAPP